MFTVIVLIITLSILVFVHEFGHFIAAKWSGIRVDEFAVGMGPKLITLFNDGETDYTIRILPIGGFVRLLGENDLEEDLSEEDKKRAFSHKSPLIRSFVLTAGITMNYILAVVVIAIVFIGLGKPDVHFMVKINGTAPNSPAQEAKLEPDTYIVAFKTPDEKEFIYMKEQDDFVKFVDQHKGDKIDLLIQKDINDDKTREEKTVLARANPPEGQGSIGVEIQTTYTVDYLKLKWWQVPGESIVTSYELGKAILMGFGDMLKQLTQGHVPTDIAGPIGVAKITSDAAREGIYPYLQLLALISINLAIVNILPFPALDGGRLVFVVIEGITGKKVLPKYEGWIHMAGFVILMILIVIISIYDVGRFF